MHYFRFYSPSNRPQSRSAFSGLVSAGYLLKRLATKARLSLGLPLTTSVGVTNCLQPSRSACCSMASALFKSSRSWSTRTGSYTRCTAGTTPRVDSRKKHLHWSLTYWCQCEACLHQCPLGKFDWGGGNKPWSPGNITETISGPINENGHVSFDASEPDSVYRRPPWCRSWSCWSSPIQRFPGGSWPSAAAAPPETVSSGPPESPRLSVALPGLLRANGGQTSWMAAHSFQWAFSLSN